MRGAFILAAILDHTGSISLGVKYGLKRQQTLCLEMSGDE
jgi:hypothetical protein